MTSVNRVDLFENLYVKDSCDVDVSSLAKLLSVSQGELADAFGVSPATASRSGIDANNQVMQQWMRVFNLVVDLIVSADGNIPKEGVQLKMSRWLHMPNSHFAGKTPLEIMMNGQSRKVIRLLEQLDSNN